MSLREELFEAIENAASAGDDRRTPMIGRAGYAAVGRKRLEAAKEFVRRLTEYLPGDLTIAEIREAMESSDD